MSDCQYIIVIDGSSYKTVYEYMLYDLTSAENVTILVDRQNKSRLKKFLLKRRVKEYTKSALEFLAYEENNLYDAIKKNCIEGKDVCVIFLNAGLYYNPYFYNTLKRYKNKWKSLHYVLFYLDIMDVPVSWVADDLRKRNLFDLVYTIDENDAANTGAIIWPSFYSIVPQYTLIERNDDLYFCGASKGRLNILNTCATACRRERVIGKMDVICCMDEEKNFLEDNTSVIQVHNFDDYIDYSDVLRNELEANCILEVVQKGQIALTLRAYEAIAYNRKLLTNNKSILSCKYYNPQYMQYFENVDDIDWDWVKKECTINYKYTGEYSPWMLLQDIMERLNISGN